MTVQREYAESGLDPESAGSFASAAVMATLHPDDWQVCQDADKAAEAMIRSITPTGATTIAVTMHVDRVEVVLRSGDQQVQSTVHPRTAFATPLTCTSFEGSDDAR